MSKKRILVVDDEEKFTNLLRMVMSKYDILAVNDPTKAMEAAREFRPDMIFLDVIMPDLDGGTLRAEFKADPALCNVPIVFLTAIVTPNEVKNKPEIGGDPFLAKPIKKSELEACINKYLPD